ncbi:MAG: EF-hand domain-containing protein [Pseudorhodobacter sp.]|nr:EF-hand domain-containing protein [Pseudorhodobacter sp.]
MTRTISLFTAALALFATQSLADTLPKVADLDGNGTWSLAEMQMYYPEMTQELLTEIDRNQDGGINITELAVAMAQQKLPCKS